MRIEKETTITFNEEESHAVIWSASDITERKMDALGIKGDVFGGGMRWIIPKGWVKFRKPRELNDEQKESLKKRGIALSLLRTSSNSKGKAV